MHDKASQQVLRRMIAPFILRRTKNDVLNELPEKTEVTRKVQLSQEEWALYDNIRQQALLNLSDGEAYTFADAHRAHSSASGCVQCTAHR